MGRARVSTVAFGSGAPIVRFSDVGEWARVDGHALKGDHHEAVGGTCRVSDGELRVVSVPWECYQKGEASQKEE